MQVGRLLRVRARDLELVAQARRRPSRRGRSGRRRCRPSRRRPATGAWRRSAPSARARRSPDARGPRGGRRSSCGRSSRHPSSLVPKVRLRSCAARSRSSLVPSVWPRGSPHRGGVASTMAARGCALCDHRHGGRRLGCRYYERRGCMQAPALRPAGKPERDPGRTERATTDEERRCRRPPTGPRAAVRERNQPGMGARTPGRDTRCITWRPSRSCATRSSTSPSSRAGGCAGTCSNPAKPARLRHPADRLLGRRTLGSSTGPRAGLRAGGQSRWSGVSHATRA